MDEITDVGLEAHAKTSAIAVSQAGNAAPRFIGTVGARFPELKKASAKLGNACDLRIVNEAVPCGCAVQPAL